MASLLPARIIKQNKCNGTHSTVTMTVVDADLMFRYIDVGTNDRIRDGGVWNKCSLCEAITGSKLNLPDTEPLLSRNTPILYAFVADDAFGLKALLDEAMFIVIALINKKIIIIKRFI